MNVFILYTCSTSVPTLQYTTEKIFLVTTMKVIKGNTNRVAGSGEDKNSLFLVVLPLLLVPVP